MGYAPTGVLLQAVADAFLMTIPISFVLVLWYRRMVKKGMSTRGEGIEPGARPNGRMGASSSARIAAAARTSSEARLKGRLVLIYGLGAVVWSTVSTTLYFGSWESSPEILQRVMIGYVFLWPLVPTLPTLLALPQRWT